MGFEYLVGVTGHQNLTPLSRPLISEAIQGHLRGFPATVVGLTSLAGGADQVFADAILAEGGRLVVVLPSRGYESSFQSQDDLDGFKRLMASGVSVVQMPFDAPSESAYLATGKEIVNRVDHLLAIWDGQPAKGKGGTADIVDYARELGKQVTIIWPDGAYRITKSEG